MALRSSSLILLAGVIALAGCSRNPPETLPPEPQAQPQPQQMPQQQAPVQQGPVAGSQADFLASVSQDRVYFDTDRFNIDTEDQGILQSQAQWLARNPAVNVVVEGHADERGTRDYNLALGERRANAAKNYLVSLGIAPQRVRVVSYGKERPAALGSSQAAWARNRRAVTVVIER